MKHLLILTATAGLLTATLPLGAAENRAMTASHVAKPAKQTIAYGDADLQALDFYTAKNGSSPAPLVIFVHGGGWQRGSKGNTSGRHKAPHYTTLGYHFASVDYRLVPDATVEQQAQDVANAIKALSDRFAELGIDQSRIVLMGHSAGAHLAALVSTDPEFLAAAGLRPDSLAGVALLDGAAYNVAAQIGQAGPRMRNIYNDAFGSDPERQRALSPTAHAVAPNAPAFLILHANRDNSKDQSRALAAALSKAGTSVELDQVRGRGLIGHMQINRRMGDPDYAPTALVDSWLARIFAG